MARARRKTAEDVDLPPGDKTTVQLLGGDGKPLTDKMALGEFTRRAEGLSNQPPEGAELRSLVARIERLEGDRAAINADLKDAYAAVHAAGFMKKVLRKVVQRRRRARDEVRTEDELVSLYEDMLS
jgi:uncharacterized protein (UPF0335 family)